MAPIWVANGCKWRFSKIGVPQILEKLQVEHFSIETHGLGISPISRIEFSQGALSPSPHQKRNGLQQNSTRIQAERFNNSAGRCQISRKIRQSSEFQSQFNYMKISDSHHTEILRSYDLLGVLLLLEPQEALIWNLLYTGSPSCSSTWFCQDCKKWEA